MLRPMAEQGRRTGTGARMVRRLVERRELPHYRISGRIFVSDDDMDSYLESHRVDSPDTG